MNKLRWKIAQFAEILWWQTYLKGKPVDQYLEKKIAYWNNYLQWAEVAPGPDDTVLDAGCGPAGMFINMPTQQVDAIDPLLDLYDEKLPHFKKSDYPNVTFITTTLENFKPTKQYDLIFCLNAINHVDNLGASLDVLVNCLRPGGRMVISTDAHNHQFLKKIFRFLQIDTLHPHQFDISEYKQMLIDRGLDVTKVYTVRKEFIFNYNMFVCKKG